MLQQTQVARVLLKYRQFLKSFPTFKVLAHAPLSKVLGEWQGLGYNRRAKFLHETAKIITKEYKGKFPKDILEIESLPGIGPYTARAISTFAFNNPEVFIETNIRTVFTHHYFSEKTSKSNLEVKISDTEIMPFIERDLKKSKMEPRDFYAALMDYGSHLKTSGIRINSKSKHYTKQSKFEGSSRQLRGAIIRELLQKPATLGQLTKNLSRKKGEVDHGIRQLKSEGLVSGARRFVVAR